MLLVEQRDDDRDHAQEGIGLPGRLSSARSATASDLELEPVVRELELVGSRQLARAVRDEEPLGARGLERLHRLVEREVPAGLAVELASQQRRLADEEVGVAR